MESYIEADDFAGFAKAIKKISALDLTPIFENLLSRPHRAQFLKLCLQKGCNRNYVNNETGKAAINYAAESLHFSNLYLLFNFEQEKHDDVSAKTNKKKKNEKISTETIKKTSNKEEETGTSNHNSVTINVENSNVDRFSADEVEESIELLPQKNESEREAVIKDIDHKYQNQTALNYLASHLTSENASEIRECMELLLRNGAEVNAMDNSGEVPLSYVMKNTELSPNDKYELIYRLLQRYTTEDSIAKEAWIYLETNHMEEHSELERDNLEEMISRRKEYDFDIDYMYNILESYSTGDKNALNVLRQILSLQSKDFNYEFLIMSKAFGKDVLGDVLKTPKLQVDYVKLAMLVIEMEEDELLKVLLESKDGLASAADDKGISLLRFATLRYNDAAVRILLSNGAYMGMRSDYKTLPIKNISPDTLKECLDSCIQMDDKNVIMDFSNISQPPNETNLNFQQSNNDMSTIYYISESKNLRHLLSHPIVWTFLFHRWLTFFKLFFIQYLFYVLLILSLVVTHNMGTGFSVVCGCFICYVLVIRDIAPLWLDISLGVTSLLYIIFDEPRIHIETFVLLSACLKLCTYLIVLPIAWIAKPFGMLFAVINTVIESGILILVVVIFSICFHLEFRNLSETTNVTDTLSLSFDTLSSSLMKSFIMSTGEYDASSANITSLWQYLLLFVFVIIVGISLFNLLVARALNDIQLIQNQAEICTARNRIKIVKTYENIVEIWNKLTQLCKKQSNIWLKKITIRKFNYPLNITIYYNKKDCNATDKGTTDYSFDFVSPKKIFFRFKMVLHFDYNSFKRVVEVAEKNLNKKKHTSQDIELNNDRKDFRKKLNQLESALKDQMNSMQTETIMRIETILQEIRHTK